MKYVDWDTVGLWVTVIVFLGGAIFLIWQDQKNRHFEHLACIEAGKQISQGDCITGILP